MVIIGTNRRRKRPPEWLPIHTSAPWTSKLFREHSMCQMQGCQWNVFKKLEMFLRGILRDFVEPFKTNRSIPFVTQAWRGYSWPFFRGVFIVTSRNGWIQGSTLEAGKLLWFCTKRFFGKIFFLAQMFWKKMDSQVDVCETAFFLFQKVGGWTKKNIS